MTLRQAISEATERLRERPELAAEASRDAELLLTHVLHLPRTTIYAHPGRLLSEAEQTRFGYALERRLAFEPMQYITGHQEFYGLDLRVSPAVLIPRPETELLVEAVLARLPQSSPVTVADVGSGSGAIAIVLAVRLPQARVVAIDVSETALAVARENAAAHGVADRIQFAAGDLLTGLESEPFSLASMPYGRRAGDQPGTRRAPARFDAIVSNPPYIPESDRGSLHPQVRAFEPPGALFAGHDGLEIYRRLIPQAAAALAPDGLLALEIGAGQRESLADLLAGWRALQFLNDLQRIPRVALARRP